MKKIKVRVEVNYIVEKWDGEKEKGRKVMVLEVDLGIYSAETSVPALYLEFRAQEAATEELLKEYIFEKCWLSPEGLSPEVCVSGLKIKGVGSV